MNPYKILGVHCKSTDDDIHVAFRILAGQHHPDRKKGSLAKFQEVNTAYQMIKTKERRTALRKGAWGTFNNCGNCDGSGVVTKSKSLTIKVYKACPYCEGSGVNIVKKKEKSNESIKL